MNTKFYNTSFAIALYPFLNKDENGRSNFDNKNGVATTISYEGASALSQVCGKILEGSVNEVSIGIPCFNATMLLERKLNAAGQLQTTLIITKNNITVTFPFMTMPIQVTENGVPVTKTIEAALGAFKSTLDGYLGGINADRHLDKFTEDYVKTLGSVIDKANQNNQAVRNNYQRQNNYQKNGNYGNSGGRQQYQPRNNGNPSFGNQPKQNNWGGPAQSFDNYNVPT